MRIRSLGSSSVVAALFVAAAVLPGCVGRDPDDGVLPTQQAKLVSADLATSAMFGVSVAVSGDTAVVGTPEQGGFRQGKAYVFKRTGTTWAVQGQLTAPDAVDFDSFGFSVAIDGDTVVIGANGRELTKGAAYVYTRTGTTWSWQQTLTASDAAVQDFLGDSVAIDGDTVLVGAAAKDLGKGAVYAFTRSGTVWSEQQKIVAPDGVSGDTFGISVDIDGDNAVVGATQFFVAAGKAYVFTRTTGFWSAQATLTGAEAETDDLFGASVSISGDSVLVGAPSQSDKAGAAYCFTRTGVEWTQEARIQDEATTATGDAFGASVAIEGTTAIVGSPARGDGKGACTWFFRGFGGWTVHGTLLAADGAAGDGLGGVVAYSAGTAIAGAPMDDTQKGSAFVFTGVSPSQELKAATVVPDDGEAGDFFGGFPSDSVFARPCVSISGGRAVVGASGRNSDQGAAYVFSRSGGVWEQEERLVAGLGAPGDEFGSSTAVAGDTVVVGAPGRSGQKGSVFVFTRSASGWSEQEVLPQGGGTAGDRFGASVAISGDTVAVGAPGKDTNSGAAYVFTRSGGAWTQQAMLQADDGDTFEYFGASVAISGGTLAAGAVFHGAGNPGAAYVFSRSAGVWNQDAKLSPPASRLFMGHFVSLSGNTVVAGSNVGLADPGFACVFTRSATGWSRQATLQSSDLVEADGFGFSVAIEGGAIVVGAINRSDDEGAAYVFHRSDGAWAQAGKIRAKDRGPSDFYGSSLAMSGPSVIVGVPGDDSAGSARILPAVGPAGASRGALQIQSASVGATGTTLKAALDTGGSDGDFSGPATLEVGDFTLDIPAFASATTAKGTTLSASGAWGSVQVVLSGKNSSHGTMTATLSGNLLDRIPAAGNLFVKLTNDAHVMSGKVEMAAGKLVKGGASDPALFARKFSATFDGNGDGKSYKCEFGFVPDGPVPATEPTVSLMVNGTNLEGAFCDAESFELKKNTWSCNDTADEFTSKASIDYLKGVIKLGGKFAFSLDDVLQGQSTATLDVLMTLDGKAYRTSFRVERRGIKVEY